MGWGADMSRSGYSDECDGWELVMWRGAVNSAIKGKRGQALLRETLAALDAMPVKELIAHELVSDGEFCTLGVVGQARGIDMKKIDPEDQYAVAKVFDIAPALAAEIVFENDERFMDWGWADVQICGPMRWQYPHCEHHERTVRMNIPNAAAKRWQYMRDWVAKHITPDEFMEANS